ncbi:MAG: type I 3-dehydroquinate dehydratase [Proteobacteria bacterium]|nr:MAG: type I 3-dehydroquinate dehydratase [Pseudomonadota bacterium]
MEKTLICVAIGVKNRAEALRLVVEEGGDADLLEIRLDCLEDSDPAPFCNQSVKPLLFTNRPDWEGGFYSGTEEDRIKPLIRAIDLGAAYVDCELRAPESSRDLLRKRSADCKTKLILSWHDFHATPSARVLHDLVDRMYDQGADIGKIVTTAADHLDVLRVLGLQEQAAKRGIALTAFCMGKAGMFSRLATVKLGGCMTYCSPGGYGGTAPGQMSSPSLKALLGMLK